MTRFARLLLLGPALLLMTSCEGRAGGGGETQAVDHPEAAHPAADSGAHHTPASGEANAPEALPLRPIMQRLAGDMAAFSYAMWLENYEEMEARAAAMADHTHISPDELRRIETELGPEMAAFEEADEVVHRASVALHEAAAARQLDQVLAHLGEVQSGCMSCHTQFRERLRTDLTP